LNGSNFKPGRTLLLDEQAMAEFDEEALLNQIMSEVADKPTVYSKLGGKDIFVKISEVFYEKLFAIAPSVPSFKVMFIDRGMMYRWVF
jgi:hypothetical protein